MASLGLLTLSARLKQLNQQLIEPGQTGLPADAIGTLHASSTFRGPEEADLRFADQQHCQSAGAAGVLSDRTGPLRREKAKDYLQRPFPTDPGVNNTSVRAAFASAVL